LEFRRIIYGENHFTAKASDWVLVLSISCTSISQARKIELHLKRMKSKIYLNNLCKFPEMIEKLLFKYSD